MEMITIKERMLQFYNHPNEFEKKEILGLVKDLADEQGAMTILEDLVYEMDKKDLIGHLLSIGYGYGYI